MSFRPLRPAQEPEPGLGSALLPSTLPISSSQKIRRSPIYVACEVCRKKKTKCNGDRPACSACLSRDSVCTYDGAPGETRTAVLKSKNQALERDLKAMCDLYERLKKSSHTEALELLHCIRSKPCPLVPIDTNNSGSSRIRRPFEDHQSAIGCSQRLPAPDTAHAAICKFYECSGRLFHVFPRDMGFDIFDAVYHRGEANDPIKLAQMFSIIAIGCSYAHDEGSRALGEESYHIAQSYLDDVLEGKAFQAARVLVCLTIYKVMMKSTAALSYLHMGMNIARRVGMNDKVRLSTYPRDMQTDIKKLWRTLVFLESWLCSTLGYFSDFYSLETRELLSQMEVGEPSDVFDAVQSEIAKVSILTSRIVQLLHVTSDLSIESVAAANLDLRSWYDGLPESMNLESLERMGLPRDIKVLVYFIHLLRHGAVMLLYRHVLFNPAQHEDLWSILCQDSAVSGQAALYAEQGISAAFSSARILSTMVDETNIFKRCWLVMFQAFSSTIVLLHDIARKSLSGSPSSLLEDSYIAVGSCMGVLSYCAELDPAAKHFVNIVLPCYHALVPPDFRQSHVTALDQAPPEPQDLRGIHDRLLGLIRRPFEELELQPNASSRVNGWQVEVVSLFNFPHPNARNPQGYGFNPSGTSQSSGKSLAANSSEDTRTNKSKKRKISSETSDDDTTPESVDS